MPFRVAGFPHTLCTFFNFYHILKYIGRNLYWIIVDLSPPTHTFLRITFVHFYLLVYSCRLLRAFIRYFSSFFSIHIRPWKWKLHFIYFSTCKYLSRTHLAYLVLNNTSKYSSHSIRLHTYSVIIPMFLVSLRNPRNIFTYIYFQLLYGSPIPKLETCMHTSSQNDRTWAPSSVHLSTERSFLLNGCSLPALRYNEALLHPNVWDLSESFEIMKTSEHIFFKKINVSLRKIITRYFVLLRISVSPRCCVVNTSRKTQMTKNWFHGRN